MIPDPLNEEAALRIQLRYSFLRVNRGDFAQTNELIDYYINVIVGE